MSPIKGVSDIRRLPRLGKIRLGVKVDGPGGKSYPKAVDYFVASAEVQSVFGEQPHELRILFPLEDEQLFAQQFYRCYSRTRGLICKGNGEMADRTIDKLTGALVTKDTKETVRREMTCPGPNCPEFQRKQCRRVMNLQFLLPEVPGLGVWQLDTSSFNSIVNVNNGVEFVRGLCGRIAMIPLILSVQIELHGPEGGQKMPVPVLHLNTKATLLDIQRAALIPPTRLMLPAPEPPETEEAPDELFPQEVIADEVTEQAEAEAVVPLEAPAPLPPPPPVEAPQHVGELLTWALSRLDPPMTNREVYQALNVGGPVEIKDLGGSWAKLKSLRKVKA